jgi:predicted Zn-dependent peptidase
VRRLAYLLALVVTSAGVARAGDELNLPVITRTTLENGLRLVVAEYHELPLVELYLMLPAGAAQDPSGKEGLAALTSEVVQRGAGGRSAEELARAIESLGGSIDTQPGTDSTIVSGEFLADDFAAGLDLFKQVVRDPELARDEVRRAREEQLAGIVAQLEQPSALAEKCFGAFLYGSHPYGRPVEGRRATVADLGRGDVRDFYDRWYRPNGSILVVVGDVQAADAVAHLREAFGSWKPSADAVPERLAPPAPLTTRKILLVDEPDATQTQIRFGNISISRADPDYIPAQVANTILGGGFTSQLIEELRVKRSLTYSAWSMFAARLTGGDFRLGTFTKTPTTVQTLALALDVEGRFRSQPPDAKMLDKAKTYLRGQFPLKIETPEALAQRLAEIEFFGLPADDLGTYRSRVGAVDRNDTARVAAAHMPSPDAMAIVVVGKASEIRAPLEAKFGSVQVVAPDACENLAMPPR